MPETVTTTPTESAPSAQQAAPVSSPSTASTPPQAQPAPSPVDSEWGDFLKYAKENGWSQKDLLAAFKKTERSEPKSEAKAEPKSEGSPQQFDHAKMRSEILAEIKREQALGEYKNSRQSYEKSLGGLLDKIKKSEYSDDVKELLEDAVRGRASKFEMESLYDDGHPLRNEYLRPPGEDKLGELQKWFDSKQTALKSNLLAKIGESASKAAKSGGTTPAGNTAPQGKSDKGDAKPWESPDRESVAEMFRNMRAKASGSSVSSLAGA